MIYRPQPDPNAPPPPEPQPGDPIVLDPLLTFKLPEDRIQELLEFAIGEGGLGIARSQYDNPNVADAPSTVFELRAGGLNKKVSVMALGMEAQPGPDSEAKAAFAKLRDRLQATTGGNAWIPTEYRGILFESGAGVPAVKPWPWQDIKLTDFRQSNPNDPNGLQTPHRLFAPNQLSQFTDHPEGGVSGIYLKAADGKIYSFIVRPLLPGEKE